MRLRCVISFERNLRLPLPVSPLDSRHSHGMRIAIPTDATSSATADGRLITLLIKARIARDALLKGAESSERTELHHMTRMARLAYLGPDSCYSPWCSAANGDRTRVAADIQPAARLEQAASPSGLCCCELSSHRFNYVICCLAAKPRSVRFAQARRPTQSSANHGDSNASAGRILPLRRFWAKSAPLIWPGMSLSCGRRDPAPKPGNCGTILRSPAGQKFSEIADWWCPGRDSNSRPAV